MPDPLDPGPVVADAAPSPMAKTACPGRWWPAVLIAIAVLLPLDWLLARLIWLPFYFGIFFFLVAGLLVGAASFRYARAARPVSTFRLVLGIAVIAVASLLLVIIFEYQHFAAAVAGDRGFPDARNAAIAAGEHVRQIEAEAAAAFRAAIDRDYPPGGVIGYVRWAVTNGKQELTVRGCRELVSIEHHGYRWPVRTAVAGLLLGLGLWLSFESLRSATPVSNVLAPGEEAVEEE